MNTHLFLHVIAWGALVPATLVCLSHLIEVSTTKGMRAGHALYIYYSFALVSLAYLIAS